MAGGPSFAPCLGNCTRSQSTSIDASRNPSFTAAPKERAPWRKGVTLGAPPGAPLNHDGCVKFQEALSKSPLQALKSGAHLLIEEVDGEVGHPLVGTEPHGPALGLQGPGQGRLPGSGQVADDHEPASVVTGLLGHLSRMHDQSKRSLPQNAGIIGTA